jgi:hypothetical protein
MPFKHLFGSCIDYFSTSKKEGETDITKLRIKIPIQYSSCHSCGKKYNIETFEYCSCINANGKQAPGRYRQTYWVSKMENGILK